MELQLLEENNSFLKTNFRAGRRFAYDLEKVLHLPPLEETLFNLRGDNAQDFIKETKDFLEERRPFKMFYREKIISDTYGVFKNVSGKNPMYGWTLLRRRDLLDDIQLNEENTTVIIKLKHTKGSTQEKHIVFDNIPKFAFLHSRSSENINKENRAGLYLSIGHNPLINRRYEYVYVVKDKE